MYSDLTRVIGALIIFSFQRGALSNKIGYYTVVAPGTIRSETDFRVSITLSDFHRSCWFKISLKSFNQTVEVYRYESIEVEPSTTKLIKLRAPYLSDKLGQLEVSGYRGIISRDLAVINFEVNSYSTFIQTNKAKFKPGELVEFRVICVDQLTTRPANVNHKLFVKDGEDNLLKLVTDVDLVQGVLRSEFQLSEYPVLGEWQIKVEIDGDVVAKKSFEVARYVLPRFSMEIKTNPNVAIDEGKITLAISSSYFHGEPVKGDLTISLRNIYAYFQEKLPKLKRTLQIDGNTTIILDIKNDLRLRKLRDQRSVILYKFKVEASLIDELSEQQVQTEVEIAVLSQPYKIKLQAPELFEPDKIIIFKIRVSLTDLQDLPIQDSQNPIKIFLECKSSKTMNFKSEYIHQVGVDSVFIKITNEDFSTCNLHAEYRGRKSSVSEVQKNSNSLYLDVLTESPEVGKELEIKLKSLDPIGNFSYEIVSRGDIIQSDLVNVPENQTSYILRLKVIFLMVPKITIYIHGIEKRQFFGLCNDIYIKRAFKNSIKITTNKESKPDSSVHINVTADEGSYVGLMGLDYRILETTYDLTEDHLYTKLQNYYSSSFDNSKYTPGTTAGLITFSNALMPAWKVEGWGLDDEDKFDITRGDSGSSLLFPKQYYDKPVLEFPYIRKLFSESWLYKDFERTPAEGLSFTETLPDTITTWAITGFSLNSKTGLTLTKVPTYLKVFQKYFISLDLPILVREGEIIEVPIYIRHYMDQWIRTNVTISSDSEDLEVLELPDTASSSKKQMSKLISASNLEKLIFYIRSRKQGRYNVIVKAVSPEASDAIQKTFNVQPQGVPYAISKTYLVHLPKESVQVDEITIDIPEDAVPESQRIEISVVGDVFRPLLRSLLKMERVPYGNGEDNMKYIVSNVLVLKYLKALNYSKPGLEGKLKLNLELGYQNQLSFKHLDGSFGLFERTIARTGDVWQTAFALWGLKQASDFIQIDFKTIKRSLKYLKSKQQKNGCFGFGKIIEEDVKKTAFALMVFLMDNYSKTAFSEVISKGLQCLYRRWDTFEESHSTSVLATYVLLIGQHDRAEYCLRKLTKNSRLLAKGKQMPWTKIDTFESNLETTADNLMNLFESQKIKLCHNTSMLQIVREFFNSEAGDSAVNHLIAMKELIGILESQQFDRKNLNINFRDDRNVSGDFRVSSENSQVLQTLKISRRSRKITLKTTGHGFAIIVVKYKYNLVSEDQYSSVFVTNITTCMPSARTFAVLEFCPSASTNKRQNNLMVMEITLQSGYVFGGRSFLEVDGDNLMNGVKSIQINASQDKAVVYVDNIGSKGACFRLNALREYRVFNAKPGWVILYDAYEKDLRTFKSFTINDGLYNMDSGRN